MHSRDCGLRPGDKRIDGGSSNWLGDHSNIHLFDIRSADIDCGHMMQC
jgi:hypothetical protein